MTYDVYVLTESSGGEYEFADKVGELTPAPNEQNCYFGSLKLWSPATGFMSGQIRDGKYLLVSKN